MSTHVLPTDNPKEMPVFDLLKSGEKTVEGRPYSKKYHKIKAGDTITFRDGKRKQKATVASVKTYPSLSAYLRGETLRKTLPGVKSQKGAVRIYNKWSSPASRRQLKGKYGAAMLAIRLGR